MCCVDESAKDRKTRQAQVNLLLNRADETRQELKLLLLGTGESGKSTIIKQMKIIHGRDGKGTGEGFNEGDKKSYVALVYKNLVRSMKLMLEGMDTYRIPLGDKGLKNDSLDILDIDTETYDSIQPHKAILKKLWADSGVQKVFKRANEIQLSDSTKYFFGEIDRIGAPDYLPSVADILRAREATTGIHEFIFVLKDAIFRMLDVGGQRSERRKWIHCFESVCTIVFIASCSEYDQSLIEEEGMNRMAESVALFEQIINYEWFSTASIILFLNKMDILREKVLTSHLKTFFPEFSGKQGDYEDAMKYIQNKYIERKPAAMKKSEEDKKSAKAQDDDAADVFTHFTCATDTDNITKVMESVKATILRNHLQKYNLF